MSSLEGLLDRLRDADIRLTLDGDRLGVNAPKGALTPELRAELGALKEEIKAHLRTHGPAPDKDRRAAIPIVPRLGDMPVSHTQQRLWFLRQLDPASSVYNVPCAWRLMGALDVEALARSLRSLADRHEGLRTEFVSVDGMPRCVVRPQVDLPLERADLGVLPEDAREPQAMQRVTAFAARPFPLGASPLMRALLIRLRLDEHLLVLVIDHIVSDGLSMSILLGDLQAFYVEHTEGRPARLPALPVQYLDYAEWQRRWLAAGAMDRQLAFWKHNLEGAPATINLPTDRARPRVQTSNGSRRGIHCSRSLSSAMKRVSAAQGVTLYMTLLAGFQVLLHRYTGESDIVVGSAVANRGLPDVERVVGFFANNLVMRTDVSGNPTVQELLGRVRETALKAYEHQDMPFDVLVDALAPRRALDHSPIFQILFVLQHIALTELKLGEVRGTGFEVPIRTARFDMAIDVLDLPEGVSIYLEYNTDLFDAATIDRLLGHYRTLLEGICADPQAYIASLPMLTEAERDHVLAQSRGPALPPMPASTVHGLFEQQAHRAPDAPALLFEGRGLTYAELNARANRLARHLQALGVRPDSLVGVYMERGVDMVVALLGVLKAGAAYLPLDPAFPRDRIEFMTSDAALTVVVTQSRLEATVSRAGVHAVPIDTHWPAIAALSAEDLPAASNAGHLAYVIYTSGSTGRPKGVQVEHSAVVNFLRSMHREPGIDAADRFVSVTTLSFDIAGLEIHGPLTAGGTVVLASRATALDGQQLAGLLESSQATILQATPATWRLLVECGWRGRPGLKMLCGGEALPRELAQQLIPLGGSLWNMYGPTETTIWSTCRRIEDASGPLTIGRPIAETTVFILEPTGAPAPIGVAGELCIGGAGVARGYLDRPELTAEKFITLNLEGQPPQRVYRTGDLARMRPSGELEFIGRRDQQVKLRGFRIELEEIESVLASHPGVLQGIAVVREDSPGDQRLVAYVVTQAAIAFDPDSARAHLRTQLPEYMVPNLFVVLDAMPLTPNGKVDRKALPAPPVRAPSETSQDTVLMTPAQQRVAGAWRQLLRIDRVGLNDNFFDLGGHSLLLVKLQAALRREFSIDLPLVELFQRTTVESQAQRLAANSSNDGALQRARDRAARRISA